ncbi:MAG TPA: hypothetical protein VHE35_19165, partial [Kofleriaceae bacterium]|nr:hypothetical protein [Kofleriaceae bacterium]
ACNEDGWSRAAQRCVLDAGDADRVEACLADLPPAPRAALHRREGQLAAGDRVEDDPPPDVATTTTTTTPPPPPQGAVAAANPLGPACEAYVDALTRYARCPTMPAASRSSLTDAVTSVRRSLGQVPAASRAMLEDGCRQATTSLTDALATLGCP